MFIYRENLSGQPDLRLGPGANRTTPEVVAPGLSVQEEVEGKIQLGCYAWEIGVLLRMGAYPVRFCAFVWADPSITNS